MARFLSAEEEVRERGISSVYHSPRKINDENTAMSKHLLNECIAQASSSYHGVPVAADYRVSFIIDDIILGSLRASPTLLEAAATGLAIGKGIAKCGDFVEEIRREEDGEPYTLVFRGRLRRSQNHVNCKGDHISVPMYLLREIYRDFSQRLPKKNCPIAVHRLALYSVDIIGQSYLFQFFVADPSRHTAAYKLAGLLSREWNEGFEGKLIVVSTGRLSDDMVRALAAVGVDIIVSFHHPLLSGLIEAEKLGVSLVLRSPDKPVFTVFTGKQHIT